MLSDQELISAYLDGELSGEELARAEHLLATKPDCRQLLEELRSLRTSMQALPRQKLESGFADAVLRRAEREILQPTRSVATTVQTVRDDERPSMVSWQRWQRPLAWSALTIAAALLIMFFSPDQPRQVAMAPAPPDGELNAPAAVDIAARNAPPAGAQEPHAIRLPGQSGQVGEPGETPYFALSKKTEQANESLRFQVNASMDELLVIHCDVPAGADGEQALREILATQDIRWEGATANDKARARGFAKPSANHDKDVAVRSPARDAAEQEPPQDAIYVVADSQQLTDTLGAMASNDLLRRFVVEHVPASGEALVGFNSPALKPAEAAPADQAVASGEATSKTSSGAASGGAIPAMAGKPDNAQPSLGKRDAQGGRNLDAAADRKAPKTSELAAPGQRGEAIHQGRAARVDLAEFESQMQLPAASVRARPLPTDQNAEQAPAEPSADDASKDEKQLQAPRAQQRALFLLRAVPQPATEAKP
jgi:anti-sigma factor RsiW